MMKNDFLTEHEQHTLSMFLCEAILLNNLIVSLTTFCVLVDISWLQSQTHNWQISGKFKHKSVHYIIWLWMNSMSLTMLKTDPTETIVQTLNHLLNGRICIKILPWRLSVEGTQIKLGSYQHPLLLTKISGEESNPVLNRSTEWVLRMNLKVLHHT